MYFMYFSLFFTVLHCVARMPKANFHFM
uniref:Uncharacterized protein n=1 Tax=Anguilla anguilla TaxID=7936 RepID=A0A0E9PBN5_ANGAN